MANVIFDRFGYNEVMIKGIDTPRIGEEVFFEGETYRVILLRHYPEGGKGVSSYKQIKIPFVRVSISKK